MRTRFEIDKCNRVQFDDSGENLLNSSEFWLATFAIWKFSCIFGFSVLD